MPATPLHLAGDIPVAGQVLEQRGHGCRRLLAGQANGFLMAASHGVAHEPLGDAAAGWAVLPGDVQVQAGSGVMHENLLGSCAARPYALPPRDTRPSLEQWNRTHEVRSTTRQVERRRAAANVPVPARTAVSAADEEPGKFGQKGQGVGECVRTEQAEAMQLIPRASFQRVRCTRRRTADGHYSTRTICAQRGLLVLTAKPDQPGPYGAEPRSTSCPSFVGSRTAGGVVG